MKTKTKLGLITIGILVVLAISVFTFNYTIWDREKETPAVSVLGAEGTEISAIIGASKDFSEKSKINVQFDRTGFVEAIQKGSQDFVNNTRLYDVQLQYNFSLGPYVENGWVYTLSEQLQMIPDYESQISFQSDLFPNAWKEVCFYKSLEDPSGKSVAIGYPFVANTMLLAYNKRMFEDSNNRQRYLDLHGNELKVPTTWNEFRKVAEFFTNAKNNTFGVAIQGGAGGWLYAEWANIAYSMGGGVMRKKFGWQGDENTPLILTAPETIKATEFFVSLKPFNAGNFVTVGGAEQAALLRKGNVAMGIFWTGFLGQLLQNDDDSPFGFATIPGEVSVLAGGCFFVSRNAKNPESAVKWILYLMQPKIQSQMLEQGLASPVSSAYSDPEVAALPWASAVYDSLERGVYMLEAGPDSQIVEQQITKVIQKAWKGEIAVEDALREAEQTIELQRKEIKRTAQEK